MVYNAMKLFMEINPTLFDECTQEYVAMQDSAPQRALDRENQWKMVEETARRRQAEKANGTKRSGSPMQLTDDDHKSQENQRKMDALKLHDETKKAVGANGP